MEGPSETLVKTVRKMMENVREMLAASKLLRARVESSDEVVRLVQNRLGKIETYQAELDRRLTKMENERHRPQCRVGSINGQ
jgi:hypothetical protein